MKTEFKNEMLKVGTMAALVVFALPEMAVAQNTAADVIEKIGKEEADAIPYAVNVIGYVIGTVLMLSGALSLKKHSENPASEPLAKGLGRLMVGAGVTALPSVLKMMQGSSKLTGTASGVTNFTTNF